MSGAEQSLGLLVENAFVVHLRVLGESGANGARALRCSPPFGRPVCRSVAPERPVSCVTNAKNGAKSLS